MQEKTQSIFKLSQVATNFLRSRVTTRIFKILVGMLIAVSVAGYADSTSNATSASSNATASNTATTSTINANTDTNPIDYPWAIFFYRGQQVDATLGQVISGDLSWGNQSVYSLELARELPVDNMLRHYLQPLLSTVAIAANFTYRDDPTGGIYEFDPYLQFRWEHFPWDRYLVNTLALGWGVSYDSHISEWEGKDTDDAKRFLNYLMFEATFALPKYQQWQLVLRIHHRSGAFGLYGADNSGSNVVGLGIRYLF